MDLSNVTATEKPKMIGILKKWIHEIWELEGNANRLIQTDSNIQIQFTVLRSDIFLKSITGISNE
jgi:hypothetical protein